MSETQNRLPSFILCGEGVTDFGTRAGATPGALTAVVRKLVESMESDEPEMPRFSRVSRSQLPKRDKDCTGPIGRMMRYQPREFAPLNNQAERFAAHELSGNSCLGVFHADVDFTHGDRLKPQELYQRTYEAISKGLARAKAGNRACPLVPMPRTDAWLLYLEPQCTWSAEKIEKLPGNDHAAVNPKNILREWGYTTGQHPEQPGITLYDMAEQNFSLKKCGNWRLFGDLRQIFSVSMRPELL